MTGSYVGYSFAVPSNIARKVVEDILEFGDVRNGILGVSGRALNSAIASSYGISQSEGFYVNEVEEGSGAKIAGIKTGDVITQIGGINISKFSDLKGYLSSKRPNDLVDVKIQRNNKEINLKVKLSGDDIIAPVELWRLSLAELPKSYKNSGFNSGVLIQNNNNSIFVKEYNLNAGYIITGINNYVIRNTADIKAFKAKFGDNFESDFKKIELISPRGEKLIITSYR